MKKQLLFALLIGSTSIIFGQTTLNVRVNSSLDDHEERINGSVPQSGTLGDMDPGSSDLELGNESATADPQLVGVRFASLAIPANATIVNAYIQFAVDATAKNTDPCTLTIQAEDNVNPVTFSDNAFSLSSRTLISNSVNWTVSGATWGTVGSAGVEQRTPDLKSLVQALVNKSGWASGNAMAFFIKGTGTREVESYDGDVTKAPELVVQYSLTVTGIKEFNTKLNVSIYPNPFSNKYAVNVKLNGVSDVNISVYDITGNKIDESKNENVIEGDFIYKSTAELSAGLYFVKVQVNNKEEVFKIIAQ